MVDGGETERVAETEHDAVVEVPTVVGIRPIVVEPQRTVVVPLHIEDVRVVVRVRIVRYAICATAPRKCHKGTSISLTRSTAKGNWSLSGLYRICDLKSSSAAHQVSSFFEVSAYPAPSRTVIRNALDVWILGSAAGSRNR